MSGVSSNSWESVSRRIQSPPPRTGSLDNCIRIVTTHWPPLKTDKVIDPPLGFRSRFWDAKYSESESLKISDWPDSMTLPEIWSSVQWLLLKSGAPFNDFGRNLVLHSITLAEIPFNHFVWNPVQWLWPKSRSITLTEILFNDFGRNSASQPRVQWVFLILIRVFNEFAWPWASHSMSFFMFVDFAPQ